MLLLPQCVQHPAEPRCVQRVRGGRDPETCFLFSVSGVQPEKFFVNSSISSSSVLFLMLEKLMLVHCCAVHLCMVFEVRSLHHVRSCAPPPHSCLIHSLFSLIPSFKESSLFYFQVCTAVPSIQQQRNQTTTRDVLSAPSGGASPAEKRPRC